MDYELEDNAYYPLLLYLFIYIDIWKRNRKRNLEILNKHTVANLPRFLERKKNACNSLKKNATENILLPDNY